MRNLSSALLGEAHGTSWEEESCIQGWGKPVGKCPVGKPRHKWIDIIKMALQEVGWEHN
jgi:hypothetical protein